MALRGLVFVLRKWELCTRSAHPIRLIDERALKEKGGTRRGPAESKMFGALMHRRLKVCDIHFLL